MRRARLSRLPLESGLFDIVTCGLALGHAADLLLGAPQAIPDVEAILVEEQARFEEWLQGPQVMPVLVELRRKTKAIAVGELDRVLPRLE